MDIQDLISISGQRQLFKLIGSKKGGVIAEDLETGKRSFYSIRKYQFSPLASISIYTYGEMMPIEEVFKVMKENPPLDDFDKMEMRAYFKQIIPNHDEERVYVSDIKKLISWFFFLSEKKWLDDLIGTAKVTSEEE